MLPVRCPSILTMDSKAASDDSVSPTSTISKPRYASMRTRFLAYVLIIFVILSTYPSFDTGYSLKDIRYLITPLPNIPMERALAIIRQYPIIGKFLIFSTKNMSISLYLFFCDRFD